MPNLSILLVEDDPLARKVLESHLSGQTLDFASDAQTAKRKLAQGRHDICFIDLKLGEEDDCSGLALIPLAAAKRVYSVVMSGHDSDRVIEQAYGLGCDDFYAKGNEGANVADVIGRFLQKRSQSGREGLFTERFVTQDPATQAAITQALQYAASELPVLILGPSGTGKTRLARLLHDGSGRRGEFVAINCSAYTEDLLEAELFGYRKGAFTGANESRKGRLLLADQGTLFLDEIGSMSLKMQTKLLKAVEERSFFPLGSDKAESSRFRIISATLEDLQGLIKAGTLRFDFFQRIHGFTVELKPLAERRGDVLPLISSFTRGARRLSFSAAAKERLLGHDWPGNVRELRKFVELLIAGDEGRVEAQAVDRLLQALRVEEKPPARATEEQYRFALKNGLQAAVERFVDALIERNLSDNGGKKTSTLAALRISTRLLYASLRRRRGAS